MKPRLLFLVLVAGCVLPGAAWADLMYFTDGGSVRRANLDGSNSETIYQYTSTNGHINYIDVDSSHQKVYYYGRIGDVNTGTPFISTSDLDGTNMQTLISGGLGTLQYGFALDVPNGKMYIGDHYGLKVANLDGSGLQDFFPIPHSSNYRFYTHDIQIDDSASKLYYTDALVYNGVGFYGVGRVNLADASGLQVTVNTGSTNTTHLALDVPNNRLFFSTSYDNTPGLGMIGSANLDGSNMQVLISGITAFDIELDSASGELYWTTLGRIQAANIDGSGIHDVLTLNTPGPDCDSLVLPDVPEPVSLAWLGLGTVGFALRRRRHAGRRM